MMPAKEAHILTINGGSSSIKFALFDERTLDAIAYGKIARIGEAETSMRFTDTGSGEERTGTITASNSREATIALTDWFREYYRNRVVRAVAHRIVFGRDQREPVVIDDDLLAKLDSYRQFDPDHLPGEIDLVRAFREFLPNAIPVACFDTAFHATLPELATIIPIPERYRARGIRRYGFHGLSYTYLMDRLFTSDPEKARGKVILAHLGSGSSMVALGNGKPIDTTMGFTPAAGLVMSTRSGDIDPGVAWYLLKQEGLSPDSFNDMINHESGLTAISGKSGDMQQLLVDAKSDSAAALAIELYCYQAKKCIGSYAAALGGLDLIVFTGGIGEHAPEVRASICGGLEFLGIQIDASANEGNNDVISSGDSKVLVRVMRTNEELAMAMQVKQLLDVSG